MSFFTNLKIHHVSLARASLRYEAKCFLPAALPVSFTSEQRAALAEPGAVIIDEMDVDKLGARCGLEHGVSQHRHAQALSVVPISGNIVEQTYEVNHHAKKYFITHTP